MDNILLGNNAQYIRLPFEMFVKAQVENQIKAVDLSVQAPHIYADSRGIKDTCGIANMLRDAGLRVHCLTPLLYRFSICADPNSIQGRESEEYFKRILELAEAMGAQYICLRSGGACMDIEKEKLFQNAEDMLFKLAEYARGSGAEILAGTSFGEATPLLSDTSVLLRLDEIKRLLSEVKSDGLSAYLDTEVISCCGESISEWFEGLGEKIKLVRFSDGNYNGYRLWGRGCLPCGAFLEELSKASYRGALSLQIPGDGYMNEAAAAERENLLYLRRHMRECA